ncbi:MAG: histidine ammonia-lyase [Candidatus Krumholzibacteriia bacterium]
MSTSPHLVGEHPLDLAAFAAIVRGDRPATLAAAARARVVRCLELRRGLEAGDARIYGVNTGFGKLADTVIPRAQLLDLQRNLVRSHAVGWGPALRRDEARGMVLLRAMSLAGGHSGVRPEVIEQLLWLLDADVTPWIASRGSVGASGDLAPLAHLALVLMGEGHVLGADGVRLPAAPVLAAHGRAPLVLEAKEGLALINGTQLMTSLGLHAVVRALNLVRHALVAAALTVEALEGSARPFGAAYHQLRPHRGIMDAAAVLDTLLQGSEVMAGHRDCGRVQDPYSVRCAPQVIGASLDQIRRAADLLLLEASSVTDNPVLMPETGEVITGGHFHGQPLALQLDALYAATAEVASVAERRINLMLSGNGGRLPRFLAADPGLESGLMIAQYLAAALVVENRSKAFPAAVDSIPTSDGQEDHVSMGSVSALKLAPCLDRCEAVVALELLTAGRALAFITGDAHARRLGRMPMRPAAPLQGVLDRLADAVDLSPGDRPLTDDLAVVQTLLASGSLLTGLDNDLAPVAKETARDA